MTPFSLATRKYTWDTGKPIKGPHVEYLHWCGTSYSRVSWSAIGDGSTHTHGSGLTSIADRRYGCPESLDQVTVRSRIALWGCPSVDLSRVWIVQYELGGWRFFTCANVPTRIFIYLTPVGLYLLNCNGSLWVWGTYLVVSFYSI